MKIQIPGVPTCMGRVGEKKGNKKIKVVRGVFSGQGKARQWSLAQFMEEMSPAGVKG